MNDLPFRVARLLTVAILFSVGTPSYAQTLIGGLSFGADGSDLGIRLGAYVPVIEEVDAGGDFTYFFPGNNVNIYEINANGRYALPVKSEVRVLALAGLNFTNISVDSANGKSHTGINLGGMLESQGGPVGFYIDAKFILGGVEQLEIGGGVTYKL